MGGVEVEVCTKPLSIEGKPKSKKKKPGPAEWGFLLLYIFSIRIQNASTNDNSFERVNRTAIRACSTSNASVLPIRGINNV